MARYQKATLEEKIKILEAYKREDFDEKWAYELAVLYAMNNEKDKCIQLCDDIILWFGLGKYVEKALSLKSQVCTVNTGSKRKRLRSLQTKRHRKKTKSFRKSKKSRKRKNHRQS